MAAEYVDPFLKQGFDGDRIRCGGCLGGLLILGSVGSAVPLLFVPIWLNVPSSDLIRWKPLPGRPPPTMTATLFRFDFEKPEWTGTTEVVPGFDWLDFCRYNVNDTVPVAKKLIEGTIFQPDPLEADQQVCIGATYACWLTVLGVLTIAGADLFILLSGLLKSILLLLLGGWLALLSAFALLLALAGLFLVDAKHLGTAPGVILLGSSVAFAFVGTTMALYQAMRATPDHLPKERQKWKEDDEELTEEEEKKRVQQILVECLDYDIPRLERYRVSMHILEECAEEEISYEEWLIEERLRMKTGKSRRAVLTEEELHKATVELRVRRRAHPALAQAVNIMVQESRKGRAAGRVPVSVLQEAFQGIDVTLRNRVTTREILAALKVCGIYVEGPAMDDLISWLYKQEEAQGEADTLDLPMFVALFNQVTDMLAKEMILKKAARGYQLTCRMAFLMNLVFLCVVLLSVTQEGADASWNSLLNVFGILFAIQFWSVIALPMLCSVLGKKAKVWRQHFCLQLLRCLSPLIRLCKRLCLCLCEVLLFIKGCCGLCKLCCGTLEDPDEEKGIAEETMSEGSRRGSIETGGRGSIESSRSGSRERGRRGSMEKQNRRSSLESGSVRSRRSSMEKGSRRSSMEKGSRRSSMEKGSRRSSMEKASRRSSMESGLSTQSERSNRRGSTESSRGPESRAQRAANLRTSRLSADSGRSSAESYSMGIDDDLGGSQLPVHIPTAFLPLSEESEESGLFGSEESGLFGSEGGDSVQSNVFEQIEKFKMERKQVRTPTGDQRDRLRSAGLAFKSEDEVFSYHVGPMRRPKEKDEVKEVEEAWSQPEPPETPPTPRKKGRRKHRRISAQQRSSAGNFFRSLVGSKEELTVVKELSINSQQSSISKASRRTGSLSPRSPRLFRRTSRGSLSSGNSGRSRGSRKSSKGSKKGFFQRLLQRRRPSVEEPERYDPAAYQLAAMREQQMLSKGGPASFSPLQVRNLRAPEMMPPMVLEDTETEDFSGEMQSTTASWSWSKPGYNWSKTTGSFTQSREPTKEPWTNPSNPSRDPPTKELRSEEVT